jgi:hypothetical protein
MADESARANRVRRARVAFALVAFLPPLVVLRLIRRDGVDVPFWDEWELVPLLERAARGALRLRDLWAQHNEHRLLFPKLGLVALARQTGWDVRAEMFAGFAMAVGAFLLVLRRLRDLVVPPPTRAILALGISVLVFSLAGWENWLWGWQASSFLAVLAVVGALVALTRERGGPAAFLLAAALGVVASYSFGSGLLIWPVGLVVLLLADVEDVRAQGGRLALWLAVGAATVAIYLRGYEVPAHHPSPALALARPSDAARYVLGFLGSPVSMRAPVVAGGVGLALLLGLSALVFRGRAALSGGPLFFFALGLFALGCAVLAAVTRVGFGPDQALGSRYVLFGAWLWVADFVLLGAWTGRRVPPEERTGGRAAARIAATLVLVAIFVSAGDVSWRARGRYHAWRERLLPARIELDLLKDDDLLRRLYPDPGLLRERAIALRRLQLSVFRETAPP